MKNIYLSKYHITERMTRVYWMDLLEDLMKSHIGIIKNELYWNNKERYP